MVHAAVGGGDVNTLQELLLRPQLAHFDQDEFGRDYAHDIDYATPAAEKLGAQLSRIMIKYGEYFGFTRQFIQELVSPEKLKDFVEIDGAGKVRFSSECIENLIQQCVQEVWRKWTEKRLRDNNEKLTKNAEAVVKKNGLAAIEAKIVEIGRLTDKCKRNMRGQTGETKKMYETQLLDLRAQLTEQQGQRQNAELANVLSPRDLARLEEEISLCSHAIKAEDITNFPLLGALLRTELQERIFAHTHNYFFDAAEMFQEVSQELDTLLYWKDENRQRREYNAFVTEKHRLQKKRVMVRNGLVITRSALIGVVVYTIVDKVLTVLLPHN